MRVLCQLLASIFLIALILPTSQVPTRAAPVTSKCLAVAENLSSVVPVSYRTAELAANQVQLTFVGHSTFVIESPQGVRIATDYAGWHGTGELPDVVTMNHAHDTHYTDYPDPAIKHVLRGWNPKGGHAEHNLSVGDVYIRNVPTNIRSFGEADTEKFGNSIFIFEVAGLCIGHLGHLHHELTAQQLGQIGQLDVVLVPVDGVFTLDYDGIIEVLKDLQARLVIPMHFFGSLGALRDSIQETHEIEVSESKTVVLSQATMPKKPKFLVLPGF